MPGIFSTGFLTGQGPTSPPPTPPASPKYILTNALVLLQNPIPSGPIYMPAGLAIQMGEKPAGLLVGTDLGTIIAAAAAAIAAGFTSPEGRPIRVQAVNQTVSRVPEIDTIPQIMVAPEYHSPNDPTISGGGRYTPRRDGRFTVIYIGKDLRDKVGTANRLLSDPVVGVYPDALQKLDDILTTNFLYDIYGNQLTIEPPWFAGGGVPRYYGDRFQYHGTEWSWRVSWQSKINPGI